MTTTTGQTSGASALNLSRLPFPAVFAPLDFEAIVADLKASIIAAEPDAATALALESELATKVVQIFAMRELALYARLNDALRRRFIAYATGADLDAAVAILGVARLEGEADDALRVRAVLAPEAFSVAGPAGAYVYHARTADPDVLDASCTSPEPGQVVVTVLSRLNNGAADEAMLQAVADRVSAEDVRPITDQVIVQAAQILTYAISAQVFTYPGAAAEPALAEGLKRVEQLVSDRFGLARQITRASIIAALTVEGVQNVLLASPAEDLDVTALQAARCTGIVLTHGGVGE